MYDSRTRKRRFRKTFQNFSKGSNGAGKNEFVLQFIVPQFAFKI